MYTLLLFCPLVGIGLPNNTWKGDDLLGQVGHNDVKRERNQV